MDAVKRLLVEQEVIEVDRLLLDGAIQRVGHLMEPTIYDLWRMIERDYIQLGINPDFMNDKEQLKVIHQLFQELILLRDDKKEIIK